MAQMEQKYRHRMYNWCTRLKAYGSSRPKLCRSCKTFYHRLDTHLRSKIHKIKEAAQINIETQACQRTMKDFLNFRDSFQSMKHNTLPPTLSSIETSTSRRRSISTANEHIKSKEKKDWVQINMDNESRDTEEKS
ncbi:uncharacterized protein [Clytia hemisphaerica]|uniref:uncharacterized protein n=1 Tax=Clytia hemisphaerica TaxID=252671 RepID=UPI0034D6B071|eukprot:TCONS_00023340-protein